MKLFAEEKNFNKEFVEKTQDVSGGIRKILSAVSSNLPNNAKKVADVACSINLIDFIPIKNAVGERNIILIFDDLERSKIEDYELLGTINDYNENQGFHVIIIANERSIEREKSDISYYRIKEKCVQRTLPFSPDYSEIIREMIEEMEFEDNKYDSFLRENVNCFISIFDASVALKQLEKRKQNEHGTKAGEKHKVQEMLIRQAPCNLRSLKFGLQSFERVFHILDEKEMINIEKWLLSFLCFTICAKENIVKNTEDILSKINQKSDVEVLYPKHFNANCITESIEKWILDGDWSEGDISNEIQVIKERNQALSPYDRVRTNFVKYLEENEVRKGYPRIVYSAYDGMLSLDEYLLFIQNSRFIRENEIVEGTDVNWKKVIDGINSYVTKQLETGGTIQRRRLAFETEEIEKLSEGEKDAYSALEPYLDGSAFECSKNRKKYIDGIRTNPYELFDELKYKRIDYFDAEMAEATLYAFSEIENSEKEWFIGQIKFKLGCTDWNSMETDKLRNELKYFINRLIQLEKKNKSEKKNIEAFHTRQFINMIESIINHKC